MNYPLSLNIGAESWNFYNTRRSDPAFKPFAENIFKRDNYRCQFCSFQSKTALEVINLDHNYNNNDPHNLLTSCPLCQQCLFIEMVGKLDSGGGILIYLPEMTQNQLNALCHVLFCSITTTSTYMDKAHDILNTLRLRSQPIEQQYGEGLSQPAMLGQILIDTPAPNIEQMRNELLKNIRLLPSVEKFDNLIQDWTANASSF